MTGTDRHPMGDLAVDAAMPASAAVYRDFEATASSVEVGCAGLQLAEEGRRRVG